MSKRGSKKHSVNDLAFLRKHAIFGYSRDGNPLSDQHEITLPHLFTNIPLTDHTDQPLCTLSSSNDAVWIEDVPIEGGVDTEFH
jgi:hypothetical protein